MGSWGNTSSTSKAALSAIRRAVTGFVEWYNHEHLHSAIKYVTPEQRHHGQDEAILAKRDEVYRDAKASHPERWSGSTRDWKPIKAVHLNPEKEKSKAA